MRGKNMKKELLRVIAAIFAATTLTGCSGSVEPALPVGASENEILTFIPVDRSKELVTIHYEYGQINLKQIETVIEEEFPDVDVVMVHDGATNSSYLMRERLFNGYENDIILSRYLQQLNDIAPDYFLDLSGEEFINNYFLTSLDSCVQQDGGLYYLPGPMDVYGIIYNKTMFEEHGWEVPHSYSEFVELVQTIDNSGLTAVESFDDVENEVPLRAIRPSLFFSDAFQLLVHSFAYDKVFAGKENLEWLTAYQRGEGSMIGHMESYADTIKQLVNDGILRLDDWDFRPRFRSGMMYTYHSTAMIIEKQSAYEENLKVEESLRDEIGMFPFWTSNEPDSDYLYAMPSYFMGINKTAAEESPEKKKLLTDIVAYLSAPETQIKLSGSGMRVSSIKNVPVNGDEFTAEVQKTIEEGRIITEFYFADGATGRYVETKMNDTVRDMLTGTITVEEWLRGADEARDEYLEGKAEKIPEVYGKSEETFTRFETGEMLADMYRTVTGADIALAYVHIKEQGAYCNIFAGEINDITIGNIDPGRVSAEGSSVAYAELTGQQIIDALRGREYDDGTIPNWYFVSSGLKVEFAPWRNSGERLVSCTLPDGTELDPDKTYKTAFFSDKVPVRSGEIEQLEITVMDKPWKELFIEYLNGMDGVLKKPEQTTKLIWD